MGTYVFIHPTFSDASNCAARLRWMVCFIWIFWPGGGVCGVMPPSKWTIYHRTTINCQAWQKTVVEIDADYRLWVSVSFWRSSLVWFLIAVLWACKVAVINVCNRWYAIREHDAYLTFTNKYAVFFVVYALHFLHCGSGCLLTFAHLNVFLYQHVS